MHARGCSMDALRESIVLIDCEGAEDGLLVPAEVPSLESATILAELHDWDDPSRPRRVIDRFSATHTVESFWSRPRAATDSAAPQLADLPPEQRALALFERPTRQQWILLMPRVGRA